MKKIGLAGLTGLILLVLFAGCATPHITGRTAEGGLIGAAIGAIVGGEKGAYIGGALGAGIGHIFGTNEEQSGKVLVPATTVPGGQSGYGVPGYAETDCSIFPTKGERAECERGKRVAERKLQHELERRAYEHGRYRY